MEEWAIVTNEVSLHPDRLIARLERNLVRQGDCRLWVNGSRTVKGYRSTTFVYQEVRFLMYVHRLFLILMLRHPIPKGWQAGHDHENCAHPNCVFHLQLETARDNTVESNHRNGKKAAASRRAG